MQRLLAKALFDNIAESPDELAFKRGDVITILEQETGGLEGWWLCSLRGKQGIAPGNRLKIITGMVANHVRSHTADFPSTNQKEDQEWNRRSWDGSSNNKVVMPNRRGDLFLYDPPNSQQSDYDVPPNRYPSHLNGSMYNGSNSAHSSRDELDGSSSSLYDTPPQSRSFRSPGELSMYDTPPSQLHLDPYDIPSGSIRNSLASKFSDESMSMSSGFSKSNPPSMCDSARSSMDISPLDMYDVPPSQREREAKAGMYPVRSSKDSGLDMYDSPPKLKSPPSMFEDYDVPSKLLAMNKERENQLRDLNLPLSEPSSPGAFLEDYDVPPSRSPQGQGPAMFGHMNQSGSRSEGMAGLEDYDVPKQSPHVLMGKPPLSSIPKRQKSNSLGSLLEDYDTPRKNSPKNARRDEMLKKSKSIDDSLSQQISDDENSYDEPDPFVNHTKVLDIEPRSFKQEHAVDDLYDTPKNNAPVKNMTKEFSALSIRQSPEPLGVYDIPPQVTRDSIISSKSDSSDGMENGSNGRLSNCSFDSREDMLIYDELPLDLDSANDLVIKLQQDVQKATNKFSTFVHSSWRKRDNIEQKLYDIKQSCIRVEEALGEFVEFGQGTLANSAKLADRKIINKLSKYLIPLQQALQQIRVCIKHLDDANWQVNKVTHDSPKKDDLGIIASLSKDLSSDVRKLASYIQGNSSLLFKRAKDFNRSSSSRPTSEHSTPVTPASASKPPINRKPALPSKTLNFSSPVQARPLPAPPPKQRPLPSTPGDKKSGEFSGPDVKRLSGEYSKGSSGEYKHWSGEFQVKRLSVDTDNGEKAVYNATDLQQEYDYVDLEEEERKQKIKMEKMSPEREQSEKMLVGDVSQTDLGKLELKESDEYEKELEQTLDNDDIDGVNIYSDDTLKRVKVGSEAEEKDDTLKRGQQLDFESMCEHSENKDDTLKRSKENLCIDSDGNSDTLKRNKSLDNVIESVESCNVVGDELHKLDQDANEVPVHDNEPAKLLSLDSEDRQVLAFYSEQLKTHYELLTNSVEAFFSCIENNEAPKVFISNSKFVVVSAHKLVYIGDSLHKNLKHSEARTKILQCANYLCECLKMTVVSTKTAALQYPSVSAVQEMVDRVVDVSRSANTLKRLVIQVSNL